MTPTQSLETNVFPVRVGSTSRPFNRGFFVIVVDALWRSHQLQAARTLDRYRHLIITAQEQYRLENAPANDA